MTSQLELFDRPETLRLTEALPIYWELEGRFLRGRSHKYDLKRIREILGATFLHQLTKYDVQTYRARRELDSPGIRGSSLNREHGRLTRIINAFMEWKMQGKVGSYDFSVLEVPPINPGELVQQADETKYRRNVVISPENFAKWADYAHPRVRRIATLGLLTLLRRKDVQLLSADNFNKAMDHVTGTQSKTQKPYAVPASLTVKIIFNTREVGDYVCDFTNFRRLWSRACRESGIWFQYRDCRRSGATQLLLEGVDLRTIQKYLGHASLAMTETYLAPPAVVSKEAARKLESAYLHPRVMLEPAFNEN